jgi:predicted nucleotidyltransferase
MRAAGASHSGAQLKRAMNFSGPERLPGGAESCYISTMNSFQALATLRRSEKALRGRGVTHAALFGSVARGDNGSDSDIDIMIEIDPDARITVFDYVDLKDYIAKLFDQPVDVVNRESLKSYVRPVVTADAIYAF